MINTSSTGDFMLDVPQQDLMVRGQVELKLYNKHGDIITERLVKNAITNYGRSQILAKLLNTASPLGPGFNNGAFVGVGTGSNPAAATDTLVQSPVGTRVASFPSVVSNVATYTATFNPGNGTGILREAGIWTSITALERLWARTVFDIVTKNPDDTLTIIWKITIS